MEVVLQGCARPSARWTLLIPVPAPRSTRRACPLLWRTASGPRCAGRWRPRRRQRRSGRAASWSLLAAQTGPWWGCVLLQRTSRVVVLCTRDEGQPRPLWRSLQAGRLQAATYVGAACLLALPTGSTATHGACRLKHLLCVLNCLPPRAARPQRREEQEGRRGESRAQHSTAQGVARCSAAQCRMTPQVVRWAVSEACTLLPSVIERLMMQQSGFVRVLGGVQ